SQGDVFADIPPRRRYHDNVGRVLLWIAAADILRGRKQYHSHSHVLIFCPYCNGLLSAWKKVLDTFADIPVPNWSGVYRSIYHTSWVSDPSSTKLVVCDAVILDPAHISVCRLFHQN
ncbi:hypothetical protein IW146_010651, partial [Coemansia sp. RSA 922]